MKKFALHSVLHKAALSEFVAKAAAAEIIYIDENGFVIAKEDAFCEILLHFLMDIAESENPIYKKSSGMQKMAQDLRSSPIFAQELCALTEFVSAENALHVDGYTTFRMEAFREKLDLLVYSLVKKIKFSNKDW
jgi:hypothetical protein